MKSIERELGKLYNDHSKIEELQKSYKDELSALKERERHILAELGKQGPAIDETIEKTINNYLWETSIKFEDRNSSYEIFKKSAAQNEGLLKTETEDKKAILAYTALPKTFPDEWRKKIESDYLSAVEREDKRRTLKKGLEEILEVDVLICPVSLVSKESSKDNFIVYMPVLKKENTNDLAQNLAAHVFAETFAIFGKGSGSAYGATKASESKDFAKISVVDSTEEMENLKKYIFALNSSVPDGFNDANVVLKIKYLSKENLVGQLVDDQSSGSQSEKIYSLELTASGKKNGYFAAKRNKELISEVKALGKFTINYGGNSYPARFGTQGIRIGNLAQKLKKGTIGLKSSSSGVYEIVSNYSPILEAENLPEISRKAPAIKILSSHKQEVEIDTSSDLIPAPCYGFWKRQLNAKIGDRINFKHRIDENTSESFSTVMKASGIHSPGLVKSLGRYVNMGEKVNVRITYAGKVNGDHVCNIEEVKNGK